MMSGEPEAAAGCTSRMAIEMFWADLDLPPLPYETLAVSLTPDELERAGRYRNAVLRRRWITARGALRHCLANRTGIEPGAIRLLVSPRGKPRLDGGPSFNLSHSGRHLLIAVTPVGRVGVDVEQRRAVPDLDSLAALVCTPGEAEAIRALPDATPARERSRAFIRTWVCKEALAKAIGAGVTVPLETFEMRHDGGRGNRLLRARWPAEESARWQVHAVDAPPRTEAAIAWDDPGLEPTVVSWPG